jgi:hypothetical protein
VSFPNFQLEACALAFADFRHVNCIFLFVCEFVSLCVCVCFFAGVVLFCFWFFFGFFLSDALFLLQAFLDEDVHLLPEEEESDDDEANDNTSGRSEPAPYIVPPEYDALGAPTKLDKSLVGNFIFQKWNVDGWCLGKITHFYQRGVLIPGQSERGNYGVSWVGDPRGTMRDSRLSLENYFAATIADTLSEAGTKGIGSWVLLKRKKK